MVKQLTRALFFYVLINTLGLAQTPPVSVQKVSYLGITSTTLLDVASLPPTIDNRSTFSRANDYHGFYATGTGSWSVTEEYADGSPTGFTSFGSSAVVTNASSSGVGYGLGYHDFIAFAITGNATVNYSGTKQFYMPGGSGGFTTPLTTGQGGTGATTSTGWTSNLQYLSAGTSAVALSAQSKLQQIINIQDFGAVCDAPYTGISGTDNSGAIVAAYNYAISVGGGTIRFPHTGTGISTGGCGIKSSLSFGTNGQAVPISFDFDSPGSPGIVLLNGGSWSTYTSNGDSSSHTFGVIFGPASCNTNTAYTTMQKFYIRGNGQVDTPFVNSCAQEQSGLDDVAVTGCNYTCIELQFAGFNSTYRRLDLFPNASSYGIIAGCELNCEIDHLTVTGAEASGGVSSKAGILITAGPIHVTDFHCESMAICVQNKNTAVLVTPSCGPNVATACVQQESTATGLSIKGLVMVGNAGGVTPMVRDGLNNWSGSGSGYSNITEFSLGNYESWIDIGTTNPYLSSSNVSIPWMIPGSLTAASGQFNGNLAFGYNAGVSNTPLGHYWAGFDNCTDTHTCFFLVGDQGLQIQRASQTGAGTTSGGGLSLSGNSGCNSGSNPGTGQIGFGVARFGGCSPTAEVATPAIIQANSGISGLVFFADSGQTPGMTYTPTARFTVLPYGPQNNELASSAPAACAAGIVGTEWINTATNPYKVEKCLQTSGGVYNWYYYTLTVGP